MKGILLIMLISLDEFNTGINKSRGLEKESEPVN